MEYRVDGRDAGTINATDESASQGKERMAESPRVRIFVVDDESVICQTLAIILTRSGFDAEAFTDPKLALSEAHAQTPDMLISDVVMQEMTGVELAIRFRAIAPNCKILLFSGQA